MVDVDDRESQILAQLHHYLDNQNEHLDAGDLSSLAAFLREPEPRLLSADWTRILAALAESDDPRARALEERVRGRIGDLKDIAPRPSRR